MYISGSFGETESLFNIQDWKVHADLRRMLAGPYSFSNMKKMEPLIDRRVEAWLDKLKNQYLVTGDKFSFAEWAAFLTYDVISEVAFGKPFGFIEQCTDISNLISSWHTGLWAFSLTSRLYPMTAWLKKTPFKSFLVASPKQNFGIGILMKFRDELIARRMRDIEEGKLGPEDRVDLLQQ